MNKLNTTSVGLAVTPTVVSTLFSHYLNRGPLKERPTAHLSYDEGLHLIRSFLEFASHHTVEELQAFTAQWVPHPQWVKVDDVTISEEHTDKAAALLQQELGEDGLRRVGGREWWQWRNYKTPLQAEWIEMRSHANERKKNDSPGRRVMMYIHGGAYFFGSVDEHRYQMQRHARKLKARVFAPKYRLSPQFPFPCGLHDCVAAYLHLLTTQDPSQIILAGDSAGGGMVISVLCILRDQGIPLPAGGILISPWVDLTHSFPSVGDPAPLDYIPQYGFHHKPSRAWPPPNEDDVIMLQEESRKRKGNKNKMPGTSKLEEKQQAPVAPTADAAEGTAADPQAASSGITRDTKKFLSVVIDGEEVKVKDQIQMYTTNELLDHPLVSPIMQPSLGGLPPLLIMTGGGEILRDEQIYLAHKCANPAKYAPPDSKLDERGRARLADYKPTDVQLQVWEDLCHVAPTLSFTRPAKYMYRSVAQFGAWCLARAQNRGIEILDDDALSVISSTDSISEVDFDDQEKAEQKEKRLRAEQEEKKSGAVGKAGDPLPPFVNHMVRQRVTRHGVTHPLAKPADLPGCCIKPEDVGIIKSGQVQKWLTAKRQWDQRYASTKAKVHKKIINDMAVGYHDYGPEEHPPPTALAGRRRLDYKASETKRVKSLGLALWSLWGSKHDEATVEREKAASEARNEPEFTAVTPNEGDEGARPFSDIESRPPPTPLTDGRSRSRRRIVTYDNQMGDRDVDENTPVTELLAIRQPGGKDQDPSPQVSQAPDTGATGKRPFVGGIAMPFTIKKEAETASMLTLNSGMSPAPSLRPMSMEESRSDVMSLSKANETLNEDGGTSKPTAERPGMETFVTAAEEVPQINGPDK